MENNINILESDPSRPTSLRLPPVRTFVVRRGGVTQVEEIFVSAHQPQVSESGVLCFFDFEMQQGQIIGRLKRVFHAWLDMEEIVFDKTKPVN